MRYSTSSDAAAFHAVSESHALTAANSAVFWTGPISSCSESSKDHLLVAAFTLQLSYFFAISFTLQLLHSIIYIAALAKSSPATLHVDEGYSEAQSSFANTSTMQEGRSRGFWAVFSGWAVFETGCFGVW